MSLLGIDIGTTLCKAAVFSAAGLPLASAQREHNILHPAPGYAELPVREIWGNVQQIVSEVVSACSADPVTTLAITSLGEAVVPVTNARHILADSILCFDQRGLTHSEALARDIPAEEFYGINANLIGPNFTMPKLLWIREHHPDLFDRADWFLPVSECIAFLFGAEPCFCDSHACRTLLYDVFTRDWSPRLLEWSQLPRGKLGRVVSGGTVIGTVAGQIASELGLPANVPIVAAGHDQCATALGCGCTQAGMAACGLGTFQCIAPVFALPSDRLQMFRFGLNIEHHTLPALYITFLYNQAGALVKWFRDTFAGDQRGSADLYARLNAELPEAPTKILVLPHFAPPVWPRFIPDSAGAILGLHTHTTRGEILKAIMECATLYLLPGVEALANVGQPLETLVAVGGGAASDAWVQINADIFGVPVLRPRNPEAGLVGAAMLAGLATGTFRDAAQAASTMVQVERRFEPDQANHGLYVAKSQQLLDLYPALQRFLA